MAADNGWKVSRQETHGKRDREERNVAYGGKDKPSGQRMTEGESREHNVGSSRYSQGGAMHSPQKNAHRSMALAVSPKPSPTSGGKGASPKSIYSPRPGIPLGLTSSWAEVVVTTMGGSVPQAAMGGGNLGSGGGDNVVLMDVVVPASPKSPLRKAVPSGKQGGSKKARTKAIDPVQKVGGFYEALVAAGNSPGVDDDAGDESDGYNDPELTNEEIEEAAKQYETMVTTAVATSLPIEDQDL